LVHLPFPIFHERLSESFVGEGKKGKFGRREEKSTSKHGESWVGRNFKLSSSGSKYQQHHHHIHTWGRREKGGRRKSSLRRERESLVFYFLFPS